MKALSLAQPYAALVTVSADYEMPMVEDTDHRGKVLICAGSNCEVPVLEGIITDTALCVAELAEVSPLTDEQKEQLSNKDYAYKWTLRNPRLIAPFEVAEQEGLFDVQHDIEYIADEEQFHNEYGEIIKQTTSPDVMSVYNLIMSSYFNDGNEPLF